MLDRGALIYRMFGRVLSDILRDFHAAEMGSAHRAEMGTLRPFHWKGLIVKRTRGFGIER